MGQHAFKVGQLVRLVSPGAVLHLRYKVLCLLPPLNGCPVYRLKTITEPEPRIVIEAECQSAFPERPIFCLN